MTGKVDFAENRFSHNVTGWYRVKACVAVTSVEIVCDYSALFEIST